MLKCDTPVDPEVSSELVIGPDSPNAAPCGYLEIFFGSELTNALVDSGSSLSFCDSSLRQEFKNLGFKIHNRPIHVKVADQRWVTCEGYVLARFKVKHRVFQYPLIFMRNALRPVILGADWMTFSGFCPDFKASRWCWKTGSGFWYPLRRDPNIAPINMGIAPEVTEFTASEQDIRDKVDSIEILDNYQKEKLFVVLLRLRWCFSSKVGMIEVKMELILKNPDSPPIASKPYRLSRFKELQIDEHVEYMEKEGIIYKSWSEYASPTFIVPKRGGQTRMVIAYCKLNDALVNDNFPTPNLTKLVSRALKPVFKSALDCVWAYWHLGLMEKSQRLASFVTYKDQWVPRRCMFGLKTAPARFCRAVTEIIEPVRHLGVESYFDDISMLHEDWHQHLVAIEKGLETLGLAGLRFNLRKTDFCKKELLVLGYLVTDEGILPNPTKQKMLRDWPVPQTIRQLRKWLGLANFFRRFIMNFSVKAAPLYEILKGKEPKFWWGAAQDEAFARIKSDLLTAPILSPPDHSKPFHVFSDASGSGIAAILAQYSDSNQLRTVDMVSRRLSCAERRYTTTEREYLAIVYALKQWRHLLEGRQIICHSDHRPIVILKKLKDPTGRLAKWLVDLSMLGATLVFNPGKLNVAADALSRFYEESHCPTVLNRILAPIPSDDPEKQLFLFNNDCFASAVVEVDQITLGNIALETAKDPFTCALLKVLMGEKLSGVSPAILRFVKYYQPRSVIDAEQKLIYVNVAKNLIDKTDYKILIPRSLQRQIVELAHCIPSGGHLGAKRTLKNVRRLYTWRRLGRFISRFTGQCLLCQKHKTSNKPLDGIVSSAPLDHPWRAVSIDIVGPLPVSSRRHRFILTVADIFSGWIELFPLRVATEKAVATTLVNEVFSRYGCPFEIHSDNAKTFISKTLREVYRKFRIKPSVTPVYSPKSSYVERSHRELKRMIATFLDENHREWDLHIRQFCLAQNASHSDGIGCTPSSLFLGREINLPSFPVVSKSHEQKVPVYAANLTSKLRKAIEKAKASREASAQTRQEKANLHRTGRQYEVGDKVWLRTHYLSSRQGYFAAKLAPKFEGPFQVVAKINPVVYKLKDLRTGVVQKVFQHIDHLRRVIEGEFSPPLVTHNS